MTYVRSLALSAALTLAPVAHAQISCTQAEKLIDAATEDFASVTGQQLTDDACGSACKKNPVMGVIGV